MTTPPIQASSNRPEGRERWLLAAFMLVSLALHLFFVRNPRVVWGDEPFYLWLGRNWLTGHGYQFLGFSDVHHPPLYPLLSGLLYLVLGNLEKASNVLYVLFGTLLVLPMAAIGRRLHGPRVGLLVGLLVALWPVFNAAVPWWSTMTEPPFYFWAASGLWAAVVAVGFRGHTDETGGRDADSQPLGPAWAWGLVGLASGLAYLTRPEGIWYVLAVGGALLLVAWFTRQPWRSWVPRAALLGLGFLLCFGPYAVYTRIHTGAWMVSEKVGVTFQDAQALARNDLVEHDRVLWRLDSKGEQVFFFSEESFQLSMWEEIRTDPRRFAGQVYLNLRALLNRFFTVEGMPPMFLPLLGLGLFGLTWNRRRLRGEVLLLAGLVPPLTFLLFFIDERYLAPLLLPMLVWTALGLDLLCDWARRSAATLLPRLGPSGLRLAWLAPVLVTAALLLLGHWQTLTAVTNTQAWRWEHRTAGEWLAANSPPDAAVMARYPAVAFHADRTWVPSPNSDLAAALRYGALKGVDYWVVDGSEKTWRPQLGFLAEGQAPPELELVYTLSAAGEPMLVYRVRQE